MKNLLLFFALFLSVSLFSQTKQEGSTSKKSKEHFSLSVIGGLNICRMPFRHRETSSELSIPKTKTELGYYLGLSARQPLNHRLSALFDVSYSTRGFGYSDGNQSTRFKFDYLDFVPQMEYKAFKNLYVSLGGYLGYRLQEHIKADEMNWIELDPDWVSLAQDTDFGLVMGSTIRFDKVTVLLRYQHGLSASSYFDITNELGEQVGTIKRHNRTLQLGLGFKLL